MKLNPDCVRDILLTIEDEMQYDDRTFSIGENFYYKFNRLKQYDWSEIRYHIIKCDEAGFITISKSITTNIWIKDILFRGHEFIANIKDDTNWSKAKKAVNKLGTMSLSVIESVAKGFGEGVTEASLNHFLK